MGRRHVAAFAALVAGTALPRGTFGELVELRRWRQNPSVHLEMNARAGELSWRRYGKATKITCAVNASELPAGAMEALGLSLAAPTKVMPLETAEAVDLSAFSVERVHDYANTQYSGLVFFGKLGQNVDLILDSGSSDLWVSFDKFRGSNQLLALRGKDPAIVAIQYGIGEIQGPLVSDRVTFGGVVVEQQSFVVQIGEIGLDNVNADGVLGLGLPLLSHTGVTLLQNLQAQGITTLCVRLTGTESGSFIALGPPQEEWYEPGSLVYAPLAAGGWWGFPGVMVLPPGPSTNQLLLKGTMILDSGTSFITVPQSYYQPLLRSLLGDHINSCEQNPMGIRICPCSVAASANRLIVYAGTVLDYGTFTVEPADIFAPAGIPGQPGMCMLEVQPTPDMLPIILGDTFLRTVLAVLDVGGERVGLARQRTRAEAATSANALPRAGFALGLEPSDDLLSARALWVLGAAGACALFASGCALVVLAFQRLAWKRPAKLGDEDPVVYRQF